MSALIITSTPAALATQLFPGTNRTSALKPNLQLRRACLPPSLGRRSALAATQESAVMGVMDQDTVFTCIRKSDGTLVCDRLAPGHYTVATASEHVVGRAFCSLDNPEDCVTYCYQDANGHLICEGVPAGSCEVLKATDDDMKSVVNRIWAMTSLEEGLDELWAMTSMEE